MTDAGEKKYDALKTAVSPEVQCGRCDILADFDKQATQSRGARLLADIRREAESDYYRLRSLWGKHLLWALWVMVAFQCTLVLLVGFDFADYVKYPRFIELQASVYFVQIIGLCAIVLACLFPKNRKLVLGGNKKSRDSTKPDKPDATAE